MGGIGGKCGMGGGNCVMGGNGGMGVMGGNGGGKGAELQAELQEAAGRPFAINERRVVGACC